MKRAFFAIALLSASWLPAVGYFHNADGLACSAMIVAAVLLLIGTAHWECDRGVSCVSTVLAFIAIFWIPWPYRSIPLLLAIGLALNSFPIPVRWPRSAGSACISASLILLAQSIALSAYTQLTARSHELPQELAGGIVHIARFVGIDAAYDGQNISLGTMRVNHPMAATWELLIDPATLCFIVGGLVWIHRRNWRGELVLIACMLVWIPARIALMLGLFMHHAIRTDYDAPLMLMDQFWSTWVNLLMLVGPAFLAAALVPRNVPVLPTRSTAPGRGRIALAAILSFAAAVSLAFALYYDPIGARKKSRVMFDEFHRIDIPNSNVHGWEPTDTVFDTESYGHNAAYTYCILYDYLSHFYNVSQLKTKIDDNTLAGIDVFVLKVPTAALAPTEITALKKFVADGGGVMLIGEHTDVFGTGTYLNDLARKFGFHFRYDCLFDVDGLFQQKYRPSVVAHPIVQGNPDLDFAVSCSLEPDMDVSRIGDRGVIVCTSAYSFPADYHASNFYPQVEHVDRADARYGSFIQLLATRFINGRVVAFTDSTQFSNFCLFDPGKSELFLGMTEWLNHRSTTDDPRLPLGGIGAILLLAGWSLSRGRSSTPLLALSAGVFGWSIAIPAIATIQMRAMPLPTPDANLKRVVMDRTVCDSTLPLAGFIAGKPDGYGIFERWILRLGYYTARRSGNAALHDKLLVFTNPDQSIPPDFRDSVERYVSNGGNILVIDSAENQSSTANSLLAPFNVHFKRDAALGGDLDLAKSASTTQPATTTATPIPVTNAVEVVADESSPEVLAKVTDKPVSIIVYHGKGTVTLVGYGTRFSDLNMGFTGDNPPDEAMRAVYQVEFDLLRKLVEGK